MRWSIKQELIEAAKNRLGEDLDLSCTSTFGKDMQVHDYKTGRDLEMTVNTDAVDADDEVVLPSGASMGYFINNGKKVFADHRYSVMDVVGHARSIKKYPSEKDHRAWKMRIGLIGTPMADTIATIVRDTGRIGASVMFRVLNSRRPEDSDRAKYATEGREPVRIIDRWELMEVSLTPFPANPTCQGGMVDGEKWLGEVDRLVTKGAIREDCARRLGLIGTKRLVWKRPRTLVWRPQVR